MITRRQNQNISEVLNMNNDERLEALEKKLAELKVQNRQLMIDNSKLKAIIATSSTGKRELAPLIDKTKYEYLFKYDIDHATGEIIPADLERMNNNFTNYYRYILQTLIPTPKSYNGQKNKFYCKNPNLNELTERQWKIVSKTVLQLVDITFKAKQKLDNSDEPLPLTEYKE